MTLVPLSPTIAEGAFGTLDVPVRNRQHDLTEYQEAIAAYEVLRLYYDGEQYDAENDATADTAGYLATGKRLPEHLRKHAYSSHIGEAVDSLADMLAEGLTFEGPNADLLNQWWTDSEMIERVDDWFREALQLGNVFARPRFDPIDETMTVDIWEAEAVWPVYQETDWRRLDHWSLFTSFVRDDQLVVREELFIRQPFFDEATNALISQVISFVIEDDRVIGVDHLNLQTFDLVHARGDTRRKLRSRFGETMLTRKVRGTADRYNALAQLGFRIARQNSFATLAVVGDAAGLTSKKDTEMPKDVADVLTFPGGTQVSPISLPTDPRMIDQQLRILEKNLFKEFGLTKQEVEDIGGLGTVSGFALEVLNRKDRATFQRVKKNALAGIRDLANMMLDVFAVRSNESLSRPWWTIDPKEVFPDRKFKVTLGSGDVVDEVGDRDDFGVRLVSRRHVLRRRGLADEEIVQIEDEIHAEDQFTADLAQQQAAQQAALATQQAVEVAKTQASLKPAGPQGGSTQGSK